MYILVNYVAGLRGTKFLNSFIIVIKVDMGDKEPEFSPLVKGPLN